MNASSPRSPSTPRSSSQPDISAAVQELLELREEKKRYQELQALLRQGLENFRNQQEEAEAVEQRFRKALRNITDISIDVNNIFNDMIASFNRIQRYFRQPYYHTLPRREAISYTDSKYKDWLLLSIRHHEQAIAILEKTFDALKRSEDETDETDISDTPGQNKGVDMTDSVN